MEIFVLCRKVSKEFDEVIYMFAGRSCVAISPVS